MRILLAPDKFKGSLSAEEAACALREGFQTVWPDAEYDLAPLADGGEGTEEVFQRIFQAEWREVIVHDPLGRDIPSRYAWLPQRRLAVIGMSVASGLGLLSPTERNPWMTSTLGTGELIRDAVRHGATEIIVGLGGSATTDGGAGMASALGWKFLNEAGEEITPMPSQFAKIQKISPPDELPDCRVTAICDVDNPLLGESGASRVFAPQKGASPEEVEKLERALTRFADLCARELGTDHRNQAGAGAAGGLGFGLLTFCGADLKRGVNVVADWLHLDERIQAADLVVTGEGAIDAQTAQGKAPAGVALRARRHGKPVIAFAGVARGNAEIFDAVIPIANGPLTLDESLSHAAILLREAAVRAAQLLRISL